MAVVLRYGLLSPSSIGIDYFCPSADLFYIHTLLYTQGINFFFYLKYCLQAEI